jgi:phosphoglucosamine mutase
MVTVLALLAIMLQQQRPLSELKRVMQRYPQVLINVRVRERRDLATIEAVARTIQRVEQSLGDKGRLLVRFSGTEPLVRVMVEGEDEQIVRAYGEEVAEVVRRHLGGNEG